MAAPGLVFAAVDRIPVVLPPSRPPSRSSSIAAPARPRQSRPGGQDFLRKPNLQPPAPTGKIRRVPMAKADAAAAINGAKFAELATAPFFLMNDADQHSDLLWIEGHCSPLQAVQSSVVQGVPFSLAVKLVAIIVNHLTSIFLPKLYPPLNDFYHRKRL